MSEEPVRWSTAAALAARRVSIIVLVGAVAGLVVGGIGGRLAMSLLAALNPDATGIVSDDGFVIGQVTLSGTLTLLAVATLLGVAGGGIYAAVRGLRIGPTWLRHASVAMGAGVTVSAAIVQDGVDFTLLHPVILGIGLFVAVPAAYALLLQWWAERWLRSDSRLMSTSSNLVYAPGLALAPLVPLWVALIAGWTAAESLRRSRRTDLDPLRRVLPWAGRIVLTTVFAAAAIDLLRDISRLA